MKTYLALGDSYTCGEAVPPEQAFPMQLVGQLQKLGIATSQPQVIAVTGWTTDELQTAIAGSDVKGPFDLVTLLIGVNNQYRGLSKGFTLEGYEPEFADLLKTAIRFANNQPGRVVVLSVPDWGVTPFAKDQDGAKIAADIDAYNTINKRQTERRGAHYIDVTIMSRQAANQPDLVASDGLHFSGLMYQKWVEQMLPTVRQVMAADSAEAPAAA